MEYQIAILFLGLGLLASLYLTLQVKMEMRRNEGNYRKEIEQIRFQLNDQRSSWIQASRREEPVVLMPKVPLKAEVSFPLRASVPVPAATIWGSTTKAKAIEMVRRGESSTKISAALSLPKPEVEFLMKLEKAVAKG
ncbi:MAG: hypothetical protein FJW36_20945 [Acidobacteria bacterium]|nr:hypothetical protein [Acidobacteriota bacterium]